MLGILMRWYFVCFVVGFSYLLLWFTIAIIWGFKNKQTSDFNVIDIIALLICVAFLQVMGNITIEHSDYQCEIKDLYQSHQLLIGWIFFVAGGPEYLCFSRWNLLVFPFTRLWSRSLTTRHTSVSGKPRDAVVLKTSTPALPSGRLEKPSSCLWSASVRWFSWEAFSLTRRPRQHASDHNNIWALSSDA